MTSRAVVWLAALAALVFLALVGACTTAERREAAPAVVPAVDASCIVLRALLGERVTEVCATAEELAPFVPALLSARSARTTGAPGETIGALPSPYVVGVEFSARPVRRCVAWVSGGGSEDAGSSARARGDGGARRE